MAVETTGNRRRNTRRLFCVFVLTTLIDAGCSSFQGPRYPPPAQPLVDEPAKTINIGCSTEELSGRYKVDR